MHNQATEKGSVLVNRRDGSASWFVPVEQTPQAFHNALRGAVEQLQAHDTITLDEHCEYENPTPAQPLAINGLEGVKWRNGRLTRPTGQPYTIMLSVTGCDHFKIEDAVFDGEADLQIPTGVYGCERAVRQQSQPGGR